MFNIPSTHTLQTIERLQLEGTAGNQVQPPAQIKAYKASYTCTLPIFGPSFQLSLTC